MTAPKTTRPGFLYNSLWIAGAVILIWGACFLFPRIWSVTGIGEADHPFIDLYSITAASDAALAGVDPFVPNQFDPYHRPHFYSEWWLGIGKLNLGRDDTLWMGVVLMGTVLLAVFLMARPRMRNECGALLLLLVSPAFLMALNRANIDLVVFVLIGGGLMCFRCEAWLVRTLGVLLFAVCAVLKYYPLVTLIVLLELRPWRRFATALALYGLVVVLAWPGMASGFKSAAKYMPQPEWLYAYGAPVGLRDWGIDGALGWLIPALLLALWAAVAAWRERARSVERSEESRESRMAWREFLMGAAMLVGVFFLGASYVYKLVFAVWLLPWLWQEHRDAAEARWCRATWWLLLAVVWLEGLAAMGINLLAERASPEFAMQLLKGALTCTQFLTWLWIACLLRFLLLGIDRWLLVWWRDLRASSTARS